MRVTEDKRGEVREDGISNAKSQQWIGHQKNYMKTIVALALQKKRFLTIEDLLAAMILLAIEDLLAMKTSSATEALLSMKTSLAMEMRASNLNLRRKKFILHLIQQGMASKKILYGKLGMILSLWALDNYSRCSSGR